jgi:hypothetical protein
VTTKEIIDKVYIESVLEEFKELKDQKTLTGKLEERWQDFFKTNGWIFSQFFAYPAVLFKDKAYVGGKTVENINGKIADFLYKNEFSGGVAIIEIKTHKTELMENSAYRGKDVFGISEELGGAINQVLDQRDNLQKEFNALNKEDSFQSFNPECFVVIGNISDLKKEQIKSFELFRGNSRSVNIITFDELYRRINNLLEIFKKNKNNEI